MKRTEAKIRNLGKAYWSAKRRGLKISAAIMRTAIEQGISESTAYRWLLRVKR